MEEKESVRESEIDLRAVLMLLRRHLAFLIIMALVFGAASYLFSRFFLKKEYEAKATIIINNLSDDQTTVNTGEMSAAESMADLYSIIIRSDIVLQDVINTKKLNMSYEELRSKVSATSNNQIVTISMRSTDAQEAKSIVQCIVDTAPPVIVDLVEAGSVGRIDDAKISNNGNPVSPNTRRNALLGAAVGLVLALAFVFLRELTNNTFKTEEDITNVLKIPVLGMIPSIDTKEFNKNV